MTNEQNTILSEMRNDVCLMIRRYNDLVKQFNEDNMSENDATDYNSAHYLHLESLPSALANKKWWFADTLEGPSLILGRGFDYDARILFDHTTQELLIRYRKSEDGPYPVLEELVIPLDKIKMVLPP